MDAASLIVMVLVTAICLEMLLPSDRRKLRLEFKDHEKKPDELDERTVDEILDDDLNRRLKEAGVTREPEIKICESKPKLYHMIFKLLEEEGKNR